MRVKLVGLVFVFLMMLGVGVLITRIALTPFFVSKNQSMSVTNLRLYTFQPIYLWSYEKGGGVFVRTLYLGKWNLPMVADLWFSGIHNGVDLEPVPFSKDNKKAGIFDNTNSIGEFYKFGDRIRVEFVTGERVAGLETGLVEEFCQEAIRVCRVVEEVQKNMLVYSRFSVGSGLPWGVKLPILVVVFETEK